MRTVLIFCIIVVICLFFGYRYVSSKKLWPLNTAPSVDLYKYTGTWYEIARLPNSFEKNCRCVKATYVLQENYILVKNSCFKGNRKKTSTVTGKAWPVRGSNNSKLKVQFFWPFKGDYWIIYVDDGYKYAIVGNPTRKYLWLLAREPKISNDILTKLKLKAQREKFDTTKLILTNQDDCLIKTVS